MKRISFFLSILALCMNVPLRAQDAATEERLNKLNGSIQDILAAQETLRSQIQSLSREIENLREQVGKPTGNYAGQDDLKQLEKAVKEIDRKRMEDYDKIGTQLKSLRDALLKAPVPTTHTHQPASTPSPSDTQASATQKVNDQGYEYVIQKGDTLSIIVQAYKEKNIKITADQIIKANPGLKAERLRVGQKIFIPAPTGSAHSEG